MLYGTPQRREHPLAVLVRGPGRAGQHRPRREPRRRPGPEPQRAAQFLVRGLGAAIVLALISLTGFFALAGRRDPVDTARTVDPMTAGLLGSRTVDADPLTVEEIFPDSGTVRPTGAKPYQITLTHIDADCHTATTGELGGLLAEHGCSQVVRAGLVAPYGDYRVTVGVFNLADTAGAADIDGVLRHLVETGQGSFATLPADRAASDALPTAQIGWRARGHYLLYCVINRPDGSVVAADDPYASRITADLVDTYLDGTVLSRRAAGV